MNRLWNLPAWLELSEAAEYLQANTKQEIKINEVSILEAALEGQVQLSVRFSHSVFAYEVPEQPTSTDGFEYEDLLGVYDLVLEGSVRDEIEYWCAVEQGRPHKKLVVHEGARVKREGRVYQLSPSHAPVSALDGGVLGLTREELGDFSTVMRQRASSKGGAQQTDIRPLKKQERETFLKVIVALAVPFCEVHQVAPARRQTSRTRPSRRGPHGPQRRIGRPRRSRNVPRHHRCTYEVQTEVQAVRPIQALPSGKETQRPPRGIGLTAKVT